MAAARSQVASLAATLASRGATLAPRGQTNPAGVEGFRECVDGFAETLCHSRLAGCRNAARQIQREQRLDSNGVLRDAARAPADPGRAAVVRRTAHVCRSSSFAPAAVCVARCAHHLGSASRF